MQIKPVLYISCTALALLAACNAGNQQQKETAADTTAISVDSVETEVSEQHKIPEQDSIRLTLKDGKAEQQGMMEKGKHVVFSFENKTANATLSASVKPDKQGGNVRIAQILMPDGTADGPFGPNTEYRLVETGVYKIVISENQMAGDPYYGSFTLNVAVK